MPPMLGSMLVRSRKRAGLSELQAAAKLRVGVRLFRRIEAGLEAPDWATWDAICRTFGWLQTRTSPLGDVVHR